MSQKVGTKIFSTFVLVILVIKVKYIKTSQWILTIFEMRSPPKDRNFFESKENATVIKAGFLRICTKWPCQAKLSSLIYISMEFAWQGHLIQNKGRSAQLCYESQRWFGPSVFNRFLKVKIGQHDASIWNQFKCGLSKFKEKMCFLNSKCLLKFFQKI